MAGVPVEVLTARLVGGDLDGIVVEVEPGIDTLRMGPPLIAFGAAADGVERAQRSGWLYRFARVEQSAKGPWAVFEFVEPTEGASADMDDRGRMHIGTGRGRD